jgi:hypothetical protein
MPRISLFGEHPFAHSVANTRSPGINSMGSAPFELAVQATAVSAVPEVPL